MIQCLQNVTHNWVLGLPPQSELTPNTIYFVKTEEGIDMYVTGNTPVPYLVGGGGGTPINLTSPNGTITITNGEQIDVAQSVIDSIVTLHNIFPDLQGGLLNEYYHLSAAEHAYVAEMVLEDKLGDLYSLINLLATPPTYVQPMSVLTGTSGTYEVGASVSVSISQTFTQNDGGAKQSEQILKNGVVVSNSSTFTETLSVPLGNTVYSGKVNYAEGICKPNNLGVIDCNNHILAGQTTSPDRTIVGGYRRYAANVANFPATGVDLRTQLVSTSVVNTANTFSFTTGTTNRRFVIAIPSSKNLVSVINAGTNENLTFTLSSTITTVPDASGTNQSYKVYTLENAVPFSTNYTLNVTLS